MIRLLAVLCAALLLPMTGCDDAVQYDAFDAETEGIVDVVTEALVLRGVGPWENAQTERFYYTVASGQRVQAAEPFEPEDMTVYTVPELYLARVVEPGQARLVANQLLDGQGRRVPSSKTLERVLERLEGLHRRFLRVKIFEVDGEYFPYVELNVNLWEPCRLYYYDQAGDELIELNTWDAEEVVGLRPRGLDTLRR